MTLRDGDLPLAPPGTDRSPPIRPQDDDPHARLVVDVRQVDIDHVGRMWRLEWRDAAGQVLTVRYLPVHQVDVAPAWFVALVRV